MKEKLSNRLKYAMEIKNLTQTELGKRAGITPSSISDYLNEKYMPKQDKIDALAIALGVNHAWLMGYDVEMDYKEKEIVFPIPATKIPLLGNIAAGVPILAEENIDEYIDITTATKADFCLRVVGDSMTGANIQDGDIVFIRKQDDVDDGEIAAVLIEDEATLKRVFKIGDIVQLRAENTKYEPMILNGDKDIRILGKAVAKLSTI